jgi:hypothetical protein
MVESHPGCHCYNKRLLPRCRQWMEDFISERRLEAFNFLRENPDCGWLSAREFEGSHPFSARTGAGANAASSQPLLN